MDKVAGLVGYIGNLGMVSVYDCDVKGTMTGRTQGTKRYGALASAITQWNSGVGIKAEGFTTNASVKEDVHGPVTKTSDGKILIGYTQCKTADTVVDPEAGFTIQQGGLAFLDRLT